MKLLEDLPAVEEDFEMLLSRKVSLNTEYEDGDRINEGIDQVQAKELIKKVKYLK